MSQGEEKENSNSINLRTNPFLINEKHDQLQSIEQEQIYNNEDEEEQSFSLGGDESAMDTQQILAA